VTLELEAVDFLFEQSLFVGEAATALFAAFCWAVRGGLLLDTSLKTVVVGSRVGDVGAVG